MDPFGDDADTNQFVKMSKLMVIYQGSHLKSSSPTVGRLRALFDSIAIIINDKPDGKMDTKLDIQLSKQRSLKAVEEGKQLIVLNSSHSDLSLNRYYVSLAHKASYIILVMPPVINIPRGSWYLPNKIQPLYCAWYLHDADSRALVLEAKRAFEYMYENFEVFYDQYTAMNIMTENMEWGYRMISSELKSCITKVFSDKRDMDLYFEKSAVKRNYGKSTTLEVSAFVITPYSIFGRVELNDNQKSVFDMVEKSYLIPRYPSILLKRLLKDLPDIKLDACPAKCTKTIREYPSAPVWDIISRATIPIGVQYGQAYINVGSVPDIPVHWRNVDASLAAEIEMEIMELPIDIDLNDTDDYYIKMIESIYYCYLKRPLKVEALLSACFRPQ